MIRLKAWWSHELTYATTQMHNRNPQARHVTTAPTKRATPSDKTFDNLTSPRERELTSCGDQIPVWNEEFIPIMLLQNVWEDLQGETLLLSGLLAPLVWVHFGVGQVSVVVLVIWRETGTRTGELLLLLCTRQTNEALWSSSLFISFITLLSRCRERK